MSSTSRDTSRDPLSFDTRNEFTAEFAAHFEAVPVPAEVVYLLRRRSVRALPHRCDPEFEQVANDLEWGLL